MTDVAVVDYGMGNLRSVCKAIEHVAPGKTVVATSDPDVVAKAERVVFPGQGAMPDCVRELDERGLRQAVIDAATRRPFLGICIGQQMLFDRSEEGHVDGLGLLAGQVVRFPLGGVMTDHDGYRLKVPHMGWNQVFAVGQHRLWEGVPDGSRFYFVHSYYVVSAQQANISGETEYGLRFTSAVAKDNIFAVQFHPEKSADAGLRLLENFVRWKP